jgi:hypothetical protein
MEVEKPIQKKQKPSMVVHSVIRTLKRWKQEDDKFKVSLSHRTKG